MSCSYIISYDYGYYLVSAVHQVLDEGLVSAAVEVDLAYAAAEQALEQACDDATAEVLVYDAAVVEAVCDNAVEVAEEVLVDSDNSHICNIQMCVLGLCPRTVPSTSCTGYRSKV